MSRVVIQVEAPSGDMTVDIGTPDIAFMSADPGLGALLDDAVDRVRRAYRIDGPPEVES